MRTGSTSILVGVLCVARAAAAHAAVTGSTPPLSDPALGRVVAEFVAAGVLLGALGFALRLVTLRLIEILRAALQRSSTAVPNLVSHEPPTIPEAVSEFDDYRRPGFAPVISLTEAQIQSRRSQKIHAPERATLKTA